ncbi:TrbI/VirB10 family protein [Nodularia sp. NIES-3585]|uniref:TrbI/VirB10 family protein n=1 Tax=Nodularia sp. NIES-3585 TaxID=1973477 RepID=UPI000B5C5302|nr:TrbI/VirB10 family protein [Nodularia sp. NIES-3585]GAX39005.1 hypothetical protein NIES3585_50570 [Nodularia sp. NIES-3585]
MSNSEVSIKEDSTTETPTPKVSTKESSPTETPTARVSNQESPPTETPIEKVLTQESPRTNNSQQNDFAAMNGVDIEAETPEQPTELQKEIPEPEEIITTRGVSQQPLVKAIVVGCGIFLVVGFIGLIANTALTALNTSNSGNIQQPQPKEPDIFEVPQEDDGQTKTALALTTQKGELQSINKLAPTPETSEKPEPTPTPVATPAPPPLPQSQPVTVQRQPPPPQPPTANLYRSTRASSPQIQPFRPQPQSQIQPQPITPTVTPSAKPDVDPMQQWIAVSNIGHYGTSEPIDFTSLASNELKEFEGIQGGSGNKFVDKQVSNQNLNSNPGHSGKRVLVGSRVEGSLETPIAWSRNTTQQENQNYLIRLTKPLQAFDSTEVLPVGSYIVAQVNSSNESGYVQMHAVSALINTNGRTEEKSIPENSVLILGKNGKLLKAKSQRGNELGGSLMASVLTGVAKAAEIQNRPNSQSTINSLGVSTVTTSNDDKNLVAGFAEGSLNEMVRRMQTSNQQRLQQMQSEPVVFVLESGTSVQLFVNQTISL